MMMKKRYVLPMQLFLLMVLNLVLTPVVLANVGQQFTTGQSYWLAGLGLIIVGLSVYLFVVIFQPERF